MPATDAEGPGQVDDRVAELARVGVGPPVGRAAQPEAAPDAGLDHDEGRWNERGRWHVPDGLGRDPRGDVLVQVDGEIEVLLGDLAQRYVVPVPQAVGVPDQAVGVVEWPSSRCPAR